MALQCTKNIDSLIEDTQSLLQQLEQVKRDRIRAKNTAKSKPADVHEERSTFSTLSASLRAIINNAQAELSKLEVEEKAYKEAHKLRIHDREEDYHEPEIAEEVEGEEVEGEEVEGEEEEAEADNISKLRFQCKFDDLGKKLVQTIEKAQQKLGLQVTNEYGYLILEVQDFETPSGLVKLLRNELVDRDHIQGFTLIQGAANCLHAHVDPDTTINLSEFNGFDEFRVNHHPRSDFQAWMNDFSERVKYLVHPPLVDHEINNLLDAGSRCNRRPEIPGVNRPYWYVSCASNTPAPLHREDGNTGSANLVLAGAEKHWIIIRLSSARKLERCIRKLFPMPRRCSQFIRHHNILVGPRWLEERGIVYEIVCQKPGEVMVTLPGLIYHQVRNTGKNFAVAINYEFEDAPDDPVGYVWCEKGEKKCGKYVLDRQSFIPREALQSTILPQRQQGFRTVSTKRKSDAILLAETHKRRSSRHVSKPPHPASLPAPIHKRLSAAILSRQALLECISLIQAWRSQLSIRMGPPSNTGIAKLAASDERVRLAENRTWLDIVLLRLARYEFASEMVSARKGAIRLDSAVYDTILAQQGFANATKNDREQLKNRVKRATKFYQICGDFGRGLLCLLPSAEFAESHYYGMLDANIREFRAETTKKRLEIEELCKIGVWIQDMFTEDVEFQFEYENITAFDGTSRDELIALLQPVSYPRTSLYVPDRAWPRPSSWPWDWPNDPTWAPLDPCKTCSGVECSCFSIFPQDRHRVVYYSPRRRGIQARAAASGNLVFREGEDIEQLLGEIRPLDEPSGHRVSIDFHRPDVGVTCRLHFDGQGNWTRLVNHSCNPCAEIVARIRPGRAVLVLRAQRDIWDGMEITVDYSKIIHRQ